MYIQDHLLGRHVSFGAVRQAVMEQLLAEQQAVKWAAVSGKKVTQAKIFSFAVGLRARPFELEHMKVIDGGKLVTISPEMLQSMYKHVLHGMPASTQSARHSARLSSAGRQHVAAPRTKLTSVGTSSSSSLRGRSLGTSHSTQRHRSLQPTSRPGSGSKSLGAMDAADTRASAEAMRARELAARLNIKAIVTDVDKSRHRVTVQQSGVAPTTKSFPSGGVFDGHSSQDEVFRRFALPLLEQVHAGTDACLMCYGQTGSGKTHSMTGSIEAVSAYADLLATREVEQLERELDCASNHLGGDIPHTYRNELPPPPDDCGIIPHALYTVFKWKYTLSTYQKYNICMSNWEVTSESQASVKKFPPNVHVRSLGMGMKMLLASLQSRKTASTRMNAQSSRSHFFVGLEIEQELLKLNETNGARRATGDSIKASATFVDLAGSERMGTAHGEAPIRALGKESERALTKDMGGGAALESSIVKREKFHESARFNEMTTINSGLSTLGRVVRALATGATHVPYSDSALTMSLYPILRGNCRTALLVNISQHPADGAESLASMRFGESMACIKVKVKQQFQSAQELESRTRHYHLLTRNTVARYNRLRQGAIQEHLRRVESEELMTGRVMTEAQQADAFRQAVRDGSIPPELPSTKTMQWASTAANDRRFRASMTPAQQLAFEYYKHVDSLVATAGSMHGEALARTEIHPTPKEAAAIRSGTLARLLLKRPVSTDSESLRRSTEPQARVITHAKTSIVRPKTKAPKRSSAGGAAAGAAAGAGSRAGGKRSTAPKSAPAGDQPSPPRRSWRSSRLERILARGDKRE